MIILSHRGHWLHPHEKNTTVAFQRSFDSNYGTETDVRDSARNLVIAHDMPIGNEITLEQFLNVLDGRKLPLAINIKADGLAVELNKTFKSYPRADWFVFDMSIPDTRAHIQAGNPVFVRMSEVERLPAWLEHANGVWLDGFDSAWYDSEVIESLLGKGKRVCVVSEDLHQRAYEAQWEMLSQIKHPNLMLCTDFPEQAQNFFNGGRT